MRRCIAFIMMLVCVISADAQYKVDRLLTSGRVALHYEDYVLSIQYFNQAISQKPYLWEPWQLRAIAKYYLEDWHGAETDATHAIELNPYIASLYDLRGITFIRQEKYAEAIDDYTKAIMQDPGNQNYWYNRAICYMESKDYAATHQQLDTIVKRWKNFASPYLLGAETYLQEGDTVKAEEWIAKSLQVDAYNAEAWRVRGQLAMSAERWKDADDFLSKALHYKPKDSKSYVSRAVARLKINNLRGAMDDYDTAIEISPDNFLAHYNRGLLRQQVGDDNRAIEDFDYVLALEPDNVMALFNRATLLDKTGNLKAAIRDYSKVIERFPNFWTGLQYRAQCYRRCGMIAQAEKDEFRILKAQMDKHVGVQNRWSKKKLNAMRKLSDIDLDKYDQIVVEDKVDNASEYKTEYRGRVQNRSVDMQYQPYLALSFAKAEGGVATGAFYDNDVDVFLASLAHVAGDMKVVMPAIGAVGENGISTFEIVDNLSDAIRKTADSEEASLLVLCRAAAYSSAQDYQEAMKDVDMYLATHQKSVVALWLRSVCSAMVADYEKNDSPQETAMRAAGVISDFEKVMALDKDNAFVLYNYATFCAKRKDFKKAIELFTKVIGINPQLPQAYYNRGIAYIYNGELQKAKADLSKAGELGLYSAYSILKKQK